MLPEFDLIIPKTLGEALLTLEKNAPEAVAIAGGTVLLIEMRERCRTPQMLVSLEKIGELQGIVIENGYLSIGSGTKISQILKDPLIKQHAYPLRQAAEYFANPLVRNRATIGGNIANGSPASDTATPLFALEAEVVIARAGSQRIVPIEDFYVGNCRTCLKPDELVLKINIPLNQENARIAYFYKIGLRKADAIAVISASVAVYLSKNDPETCQKCVIALGSVASRPVRAKEAEEILCGQILTEEKIEQVATTVQKVTTPISDIRGSATYRYDMAKVIVSRLLHQIADDKAG